MNQIKKSRIVVHRYKSKKELLDNLLKYRLEIQLYVESEFLKEYIYYKKLLNIE